MRLIASSACTPMTLSCGPVIPASLSAAVPPGRTRASFVCTCVCVPITAVTLPSSHFAERDLLAGRLGVDVDEDDLRLAPRLLDEPVDDLPHAHGTSMKSEPITLITATRVPSRAATTARPCPGSEEREVRRAYHAVGAREVRHDLDPAPRVVAERDRVDAGGEEPVGELRRDPRLRPRRSRRSRCRSRRRAPRAATGGAPRPPCVPGCRRRRR